MYKQPLIFGEVLFDSFSDQNEILGGAPLNVAWNLKGFGLEPLLISRLGCDARQKRALEQLRSWNLDTSALQFDQHKNTGLVRIHKTEINHSFEILSDQAYDFIDAGEFLDHLQTSKEEFSVFYHGTLALRNEVSRDSCFEIQDRLELPSFVDVNLRPPWWDMPLLTQVMRRATWVKLNEDELQVFANKERSTSSENDPAVLSELAQNLVQEFELEYLIITRGEKGAFFADRFGKSIFVESPDVANFVDSVGAGDAFASVMLLGLLSNWDYQLTLERAVQFASEIISIQGATFHDQEFFKRHLVWWQSK